jgi:hypothetical protein
MSKCRSGCPTQDHASWGECARGMGLQIGDLGRGVAAATDRRLDAYASARRQGLQPPSTKLTDSRRTLQLAGA